jgi:Novel STAND NTPase 1/WD domain, G-beta repeat
MFRKKWDWEWTTIASLVVVAIRSDSYERLQTEPRLLHVAQHPFSLPPMPAAEYKAVIEGPATRASEAGRNLTVDPALTEALVHDAEGADALPLLAFTLERLYVEYGGSGRLRRQDYEALGGVRGSIEAAVEAAFAEAGREPAIPADRGFREPLLRAGFIPWLARIDPDTEERKRRVARWEEIPSEARPLIERLIEQRLLVRDRRRLVGGQEGIVIEVAHEALLRQWPSLSSWLEEDATALKVLGTVQRAADEWKSREENSGGEAWLVHTGERLVEAEALRRRPDFERLLGANGQAYLDACRKRDERVRQEKEEQLKRIAEERDRAERERERAEAEAERARTAAEAAEEARQKSTQRFQWAVGAAALALVIAIGAGWFWKQSSDRQHEIALSSGTFVAADMAATDPTVAILGLAAILGEKRAPAAAWNAVFGLLDAQLSHARFPHNAIVLHAAFSPDGKQVVTASWDKTARLWDLKGGLLAELKGHGDIVDHAAFSPDGQQVVTASGDKTARLWPVVSAPFHEWVLQFAMPCLNSLERERILLEDNTTARQHANACAREHGLPEEAAPNQKANVSRIR